MAATNRPLIKAALLMTLLGWGLAGAAPALAQELTVSPQGWAKLEGKTYRCVLGRSGVRKDKREGDGATPAGTFPLRQVLYRPDKLPAPPASGLPAAALSPDQGWCDDPARPEYNRPVRLPFSGGHEQLWRADDLYDLIVVVGYNDDPVTPGRGSAIFLHLAAPDLRPTAGCVAFSRQDLLEIAARLGPEARVRIIPAP